MNFIVKSKEFVIVNKAEHHSSMQLYILKTFQGIPKTSQPSVISLQNTKFADSVNL